MAPDSAQFLADARVKSVSFLLPAETWPDNLWVYARDGEGAEEHKTHYDLWEADKTDPDRLAFSAEDLPTILAQGEHGVWFAAVLPNDKGRPSVLIRGESGAPAEVVSAPPDAQVGFFSIARTTDAPQDVWQADPLIFFPQGQTVTVVDDDERVFMLPGAEGEESVRCVVARVIGG